MSKLSNLFGEFAATVEKALARAVTSAVRAFSKGSLSGGDLTSLIIAIADLAGGGSVDTSISQEELDSTAVEPEVVKQVDRVRAAAEKGVAKLQEAKQKLGSGSSPPSSTGGAPTPKPPSA